MSGSAKLPKEVRTQLGVGAILTIVGMVWMFVIVFILKPDQIVPTKDALSDAYDGMRALASIPFDHWTLRTIGELAGQFVVLLLMNILLSQLQNVDCLRGRGAGFGWEGPLFLTVL